MQGRLAIMTCMKGVQVASKYFLMAVLLKYILSVLMGARRAYHVATEQVFSSSARTLWQHRQ